MLKSSQKQLIQFGLFALLTLSACATQQIPIDEDMNQRQAAISTSKQFMNALIQQKLQSAVALTTPTMWLDGSVESQKTFAREVKRELPRIAGYKVHSARFYSKEDLQIFMPELLTEIKAHQQPHDYFVVVRMLNAKGIEADALLLSLVYQNDKWKISGIDD